MQTENSGAQTRRELLLRAGAGAAALAFGAGTSRAEGGKGPQPKIVVGSGEHKYECIHDWLTPPDDILWGDTQGLCQDSAGRIYVSHTVHSGSKKNNAIVVFDKHGKFLTSWGEEFVGGGHGIEVRREGDTNGEGGEEFLYHCDTNHRKVVKTTLTGKIIWEKTTPQEPGVYDDKHAFVPTNVAFSPNGDFYITDGYGSNYIHQYDIEGNWIRTFGGSGNEGGKFRCSHGIAVDHRGKEPMLLVTDRSNARNQYLSLDGKFVSFQNDKMRLPCYLSFRKDVVAVADLTAVVTLVDPKGHAIAMLGDGVPDAEPLRDHPRKDFIPGKFVHPHCVRFLQNGDILVAEWVPIGRLTLLKKLRA
jgi:DNA-binding beta-propeller fold protein YncE